MLLSTVKQCMLIGLYAMCAFCHRLEAAVKENDFVYHGIVPEMDKLPEIKGIFGLITYS